MHFQYLIKIKFFINQQGFINHIFTIIFLILFPYLILNFQMQFFSHLKFNLVCLKFEIDVIILIIIFE